MKMKEIVKNNTEWEILTPTGWQEFGGIKKVKKDSCLKIKFELPNKETKEIICSKGHQLMAKRNKEIMFCFSEMLEITDKLLFEDNKSFCNIISIEIINEDIELYDLINVKNGYEYIANNIINHNCAHVEGIDELWLGLQPTLSCVAGDTLVLTDNGFVKIEDFHENKKIGDYFELEIPIYGKNGIEKTSHGYVSPESDTLIITTTSGHCVEVTPKHPLYVLKDLCDDEGEMIEAQKLKIGNELRIEIAQNCFGKTEINYQKLKNYYEEFLFNLNNKNYFLPKEILQGNKEAVEIFLSTVFEKSARIKSENRKLLLSLHLLLHNLGFKSELTYDKQNDLYFLNKGSENFYYKNHNFYWDVIKSIEKSFNKTYDFTVPETHSFLQNGILGSNTGGNAILISSPSGVGTLFHKIWSASKVDTDENGEGKNGFLPIELPWTVHPERDEKWFETQREEIIVAKGERGLGMELLCNFASSGDTFIKGEALDTIHSSIKKPQSIQQFGRDEIWIWSPPEDGVRYVIGADVARGDGEDYSAFNIINTETNEVVADFKGKPPPDKFADLLITYGNLYNEALICQELNNVGVACAIRLKDSGYRNLFYEKHMKNMFATYNPQDIKDDLPGFTTNQNTRVEMLAKLENTVRNKNIILYSKRMFEELQTFVWKGNKPQAQKGYNDDLVMSLAIACNTYETSAGLNKYSNVEMAMALLNGMSRESKTINTMTGEQKVRSYTANIENEGPITVQVDNLLKKQEEEDKINKLKENKRRMYGQYYWLFDD